MVAHHNAVHVLRPEPRQLALVGDIRIDVPAAPAARLTVGLVERRPVPGRPDAAAEPPQPLPNRSHARDATPNRDDRGRQLPRPPTSRFDISVGTLSGRISE